MKQENRALLIKYIVCFVIASLITFCVFWIKGFFGESVAVNVQVLADGFTVSGLLVTLFAGLLFVSGEGALIGIGFVLRNVVLIFLPMGRARHEKYADYRARKMETARRSNDSYILIVGLFFLVIGIILNVVWYVNFYNMV